MVPFPQSQVSSQHQRSQVSLLSLDSLQQQLLQQECQSKMCSSNSHMMINHNTIMKGIMTSRNNNHTAIHYKTGKPKVSSSQQHRTHSSNVNDDDDDVRRDIAIIQHRNYLDPKHFFKSNDTTMFPSSTTKSSSSSKTTTIHMGTMIDGPLEGGRSSNISNWSTNQQQQPLRTKHTTIFQQVMKDTQITKYITKKHFTNQLQKKTKKMKMIPTTKHKKQVSYKR